MQLPITSVQDLGLAVRAVRQSRDVRLDDLAFTVGLSKQYATDLERGKPTLRMGLVFKLLEELGLRLVVDMPQSAQNRLQELQAKPAKPPSKPRAKSMTQPPPPPPAVT